MVEMAVLKFCAEKAGKAALKDLSKQLGSDGKWLAELIRDQNEDIKLGVDEVKAGLAEVFSVVKTIEVDNNFGNYNTASQKFGQLQQAYLSNRTNNDADGKKTACLNVLGPDGVLTQARTMIQALVDVKISNNRSFLGSYSDFVIREFHSVFRYHRNLTALADDLRTKVAKAVALRQQCLTDLQGLTGISSVEELVSENLVRDTKFTMDDMNLFETHFAEVTRIPFKIKETFDRLAKDGTTVALQHHNSGNYLTGYAQGVSGSPDEPFQDHENSFWFGRTRGVPTVFLADRADGKVRQYKLINRGSPWDGTGEVLLDKPCQGWSIVKITDNGDHATTVMFKHEKSGQALDGMEENLLYIHPFDAKNEYMRWEPVPARGKQGELIEDVFLLKHRKSSPKCIDANGKRLYASNIQHGNAHQCWRIVTS